MKTKSPTTFLFMNILFAVVTIAMIVSFFTMLILDYTTTSVVVFLVFLLAWLAAFAVWCASRLERKPKAK